MSLENNFQNKFSQDGSMIYLSDLNVRQLRSSDSKKFLNRWTLETKNFTSGWKSAEKDESDGTADISGESDEDTAWQHTPFWSGRHIKGEFSSQYPYSGYSIHVFAGDEEVSNLSVENGRSNFKHDDRPLSVFDVILSRKGSSLLPSMTDG